MLRFTKGFIKKPEDNKPIIPERDKMEQIRNQMGGLYNKKEIIKPEEKPLVENKMIHRDRMDALKNIKKF